MIYLFTDFGWQGPYVGQMKAVLTGGAPQVPIIDLMHDAPAFDPRAASYLLAAVASRAAPGSVLLAVVDPGVGGSRRPVMVQCAGRWLVGPDNGLLALLARRWGGGDWQSIGWRPAKLAPTFHGRDLFAPVAAALARGQVPEGEAMDDPEGAHWPDDLSEIIYVDSYGNLITGLRAAALSPQAVLSLGERRLTRAATFSERAEGEPFWYENSSGLVEIAASRGSAASLLSAKVGDGVDVADGVQPPPAGIDRRGG